jgi:hypothetical protein
MAKTPGGQARGLDRLVDRAADHGAGVGVGRVALDDHRAAGRQGRGGVAAGRREGQREVAGAEHHHRAQRDEALAQVGAGQGRAVGHGRIDPRADPVAAPHDLGEQPQLAAGAAALAGDPGLGQAGLGHGGLDQLVAQRLDLGGDRLQEGGAGFQVGLAIDVERGLGGGEGRLDLVRRWALGSWDRSVRWWRG